MKKVLWQELRRTEFEEAVKADTTVIIPVGSTEQHGNHLQINTDVNCCFTIAQHATQVIDEFPGCAELFLPNTLVEIEAIAYVGK